MAVSLPRVGGPSAVTRTDRLGETHRHEAGAERPPLGGFWPVAPEGGVPGWVGYRRAASFSAAAGPSTSEPGFAYVLGAALAFGVEVDWVVPGDEREVRAAGQVNDVAHGGSFIGGSARAGGRGPGAGRRSADPPHGDRRNGAAARRSGSGERRERVVWSRRRWRCAVSVPLAPPSALDHRRLPSPRVPGTLR
jgi:hypothetical protein